MSIAVFQKFSIYRYSINTDPSGPSSPRVRTTYSVRTFSTGLSLPNRSKTPTLESTTSEPLMYGVTKGSRGASLSLFLPSGRQGFRALKGLFHAGRGEDAGQTLLGYRSPLHSRLLPKWPGSQRRLYMTRIHLHVILPPEFSKRLRF